MVKLNFEAIYSHFKRCATFGTPCSIFIFFVIEDTQLFVWYLKHIFEKSAYSFRVSNKSSNKKADSLVNINQNISQNILDVLPLSNLDKNISLELETK